ncbi:MAG: hypothetical protein EXR36_14075 [Betaproteobacteria bacterium]|nr:hypothetical protein [Betaproteobacteria bacterium]
MYPNRKFKHQVLAAIAVSAALFAGAAQADKSNGASPKCSSPNTALCGKVSADVNRCVQDKSCRIEARRKDPDERSALWLLTELFFSRDR